MAAIGFDPDDDLRAVLRGLRSLPDKVSAMDEKVDRIEAHVSETNGRVRKLEIWQAFMQGGAATNSRLIQGGLILVSALIGGAAGHFLA